MFQNDKDGKGIYNAENIYYYLDTKLLKFEKNVKIDFIPRKKKENKKEDNKTNKSDKNNKKKKKDKEKNSKS